MVVNFGEEKKEPVRRGKHKFTYTIADASFWKSWRIFKYANVQKERRTGINCWYCGVPTIPLCGENRAFGLTMDHVNPRSRGGKRFANLVPACVYCNSLKSNATLEEFRYFLAGKWDCPIAEIMFFGEMQGDVGRNWPKNF